MMVMIRMKKHLAHCAVLLFAALIMAVAPRAHSAPDVVTTEPCNAFWKDIEIGTRITWFQLLDSKRDASAVSTAQGSFYGSITELSEKQNLLPIKLFIDYKMSPFWGFELTWDQIRADTITRGDGHNDGTIDLEGPIASVFGRYPNSSFVTPYGGIGLAYFFGNFNDDYSWHYAIDPGTGFHHNGDAWSQTMDLDNAVGFVAYVGMIMAINRNWKADVFARYMDVDVDGTHTTFLGDDVTSEAGLKFPLSNLALGVGVRYCF